MFQPVFLITTQVPFNDAGSRTDTAALVKLRTLAPEALIAATEPSRGRFDEDNRTKWRRGPGTDRARAANFSCFLPRAAVKNAAGSNLRPPQIKQSKLKV